MRRKWNRLYGLVSGSVFITAFITIQSIRVTASDRTEPLTSKERPIEQIPVIDGSFVHNIGDLQMNITNWGIIGSMPNSNFPMRDVPSAQYPAGSGIEYLFAAGIWVGAERSGLPSVSTGYPEDEFRPNSAERYTLYETYEGDLRGSHYPMDPDDDRDGRIDEDRLNGIDDDNDGKTDEDFAAYGNQMFCCEFTDTQPLTRQLWPEHEPLELLVYQETFQWAEDIYNDFIACRYTITNNGFHNLVNAYIGIYADLDAGPRDRGNYHRDDKVGLWRGEWCAPRGNGEYPVDISIAYVYDDDGDGGRTTGYFGIAVLGHSPQFTGAPPALMQRLQLNSFRVFRGLQPYANGGDPTNDFERYETLSRYGFDEDTETAGDYRVLLSIGPFYNIAFGEQAHVDLAFVSGESLDAMRDHAAAAQFIYEGIFFDLDRNPGTGVIGREIPMAGPLEDVDPDPCDGVEEKIDVVRGDTIWVNVDCRKEQYKYFHNLCYRDLNARFKDYQTGVDGKEARINWIVGGAPPPPNIRVVPGDGKVIIHWDNLSETTPDIVSGMFDFEGYQVWRAEDWHRPLGSSEKNGPESHLWGLIEGRDLVNGVIPDVDFRKPFEEGGWQYTPLLHIEDREMSIKAFEEVLLYAPLDHVPCPPGFTREECDTLEAVARDRLGFEGGRQYYKFVDEFAKNGLPYFYSVVAYDHNLGNGVPSSQGRFTSPSANFAYVEAKSASLEADGSDEHSVYVVPNPVTMENISPWQLGP
ncbi:MAG TPA: hypothetical protein VLA34_15275, partial [Candidatus Krumholzibacterium sp.]|nr:hypothetical protein [Candidatus Krumholzibacterium sp.]